MTDIKWFKLDSHTFDTARMKYIGKVDKNGALYQLIWIKLLCEAAKLGDGGRIYVYKGRSIRLGELAILLDMEEEQVGDAMALFDALDMVKCDDLSGLVIKNFSDYVGEGYGVYEDSSGLDGEEEFAEREYEMTEEELKRERNREAQRRWRERQREIKSEAKEKQNGLSLNKADRNNGVIQSNDGVINRNNTVISSNSNRNDTVIERNTEHNENNADSVISSPKNIFIEEKRIEESRIEEKREEEIRKEETNNNFSASLPKASLREGGGPSLTVEGDYDKHSVPQGDGYESEADISPQGTPPPAHAEEKEKNEKRYYGIFNNVYLSESELSRLRAEFGDILPELIDELSTGMESEGKSYNNHFATLLRWGKNKYAPRRRKSSVYVSESRDIRGNCGETAASSFSESEMSVYRPRDETQNGFPQSAYSHTGGNIAQKKDSRRGGCESVRTLTKDEAEEAFRRALERSSLAG